MLAEVVVVEQSDARQQRLEGLLGEQQRLLREGFQIVSVLGSPLDPDILAKIDLPPFYWRAAGKGIPSEQELCKNLHGQLLKALGLDEDPARPDGNAIYQVLATTIYSIEEYVQAAVQLATPLLPQERATLIAKRRDFEGLYQSDRATLFSIGANSALTSSEVESVQVVAKAILEAQQSVIERWGGDPEYVGPDVTLFTDLGSWTPKPGDILEFTEKLGAPRSRVMVAELKNDRVLFIDGNAPYHRIEVTQLRDTDAEDRRKKAGQDGPPIYLPMAQAYLSQLSESWNLRHGELALSPHQDLRIRPRSIEVALDPKQASYSAAPGDVLVGRGFHMELTSVIAVSIIKGDMSVPGVTADAVVYSYEGGNLQILGKGGLLISKKEDGTLKVSGREDYDTYDIDRVLVPHRLQPTSPTR